MEDATKAPWSGADLTYAGWVPNVRSHLSFSGIGASRRAEAYTRSYAASPRRLVLAFERRVSNDYPWWTPLVAFVRRDLVHNWLLEALTCSTEIPLPDAGVTEAGEIVCEPDRQGMLLGRVHILPTSCETWSAFRRQRGIAREIRKDLLLAPDRPSDLELVELQKAVIERARDSDDHSEIHFALMRNGELRLWYDPENTPAVDKHDLWLLAEQAYFFVKDVVHDHTHHDPSSDQITPLVSTASDPNDPSHSGDVAWRRETLWSLSREVERLNRDGGLVGHRRSLGVIAYADAFQRSLMGHIRDPIDTSRFVRRPQVYNYDFGHLKDSIRASVDVAAARKAQTAQLFIAFVATLLSAISVVGSLTSAHNGAQIRRKSGVLVNAINFDVGDAFVRHLAWNPFFTGGIFAALMLGFAGAILADGSAGLYNSFQRVVSQLSRAAAVSVAWSSRSQVVIDWLLHLAAATLSFLLSALCIAVITGAL